MTAIDDDSLETCFGNVNIPRVLASGERKGARTAARLSFAACAGRGSGNDAKLPLADFVNMSVRVTGLHGFSVFGITVPPCCDTRGGGGGGGSCDESRVGSDSGLTRGIVDSVCSRGTSFVGLTGSDSGFTVGIEDDDTGGGA